MSRAAIPVLVALLVAGLPAAGQDVSGPLDQEYRLVVGDSIQVVVVGQEDLEREYVVPGNGIVSFPPLGKVNLLKRTVPELEREISERLKAKGQLTDPEVYILVTENAPRSAYLMGAVSGQVDLPPYQRSTIVQVLAKASVSQATVDLRNVKILRKKPTGEPYPIFINVEEILSKNRFENDIVIMPGDVIVLQSYRSVSTVAYVYVLGKVNGPGRYEFFPGRDDFTLAKLISLTGGFAQFADQSEIRILRKDGNRTRAIDIDFSDIIENEIQDYPLKPDDLIFVPESPW